MTTVSTTRQDRLAARDGVDVLTRKKAEDLADQRARDLLGVPSRVEAFRKLESGELHGTAAEAIIRNLRYLLNA